MIVAISRVSSSMSRGVVLITPLKPELILSTFLVWIIGQVSSEILSSLFIRVHIFLNIDL